MSTKRPLAPKGGNDRVYTPDALARQIVRHFKPCGAMLEPCRGRGAFYNALLEAKFQDGGSVEFAEIDGGIDFLTIGSYRFDWVVTNPPWSQFRAFLGKSMEVADNVVFLSLVNAFFMRARVEDMRKAGFRFVEILMLPTPPKPWPQTGFQLGATHIKRGYSGSCKVTYPKQCVHDTDGDGDCHLCVKSGKCLNDL